LLQQIKGPCHGSDGVAAAAARATSTVQALEAPAACSRQASEQRLHTLHQQQPSNEGSGGQVAGLAVLAAEMDDPLLAVEPAFKQGTLAQNHRCTHCGFKTASAKRRRPNPGATIALCKACCLLASRTVSMPTLRPFKRPEQRRKARLGALCSGDSEQPWSEAEEGDEAHELLDVLAALAELHALQQAPHSTAPTLLPAPKKPPALAQPGDPNANSSPLHSVVEALQHSVQHPAAAAAGLTPQLVAAFDALMPHVTAEQVGTEEQTPNHASKLCHPRCMDGLWSQTCRMPSPCQQGSFLCACLEGGRYGVVSRFMTTALEGMGLPLAVDLLS
jgi:hypothetical protein